MTRQWRAQHHCVRRRRCRRPRPRPFTGDGRRVIIINAFLNGHATGFSTKGGVAAIFWGVVVAAAAAFKELRRSDDNTSDYTF